MLRVKSLDKFFGGFHAVNDFSLEVAQGELVTLLGPSGCGKSTTLRCIAGLDMPDSGLIEMGGDLIYSDSRGVDVLPEKRRVGMVFQSYALWPHMSVLENVAYPLLRQKLPSAARQTKAMAALDLVGLSGSANAAPGNLSGGQQQRVALARALASECRILLFDEPLSNLDVRLREQLRSEIRDIQKRLKITAIYVTHDQSEALAISDRIVVMEKGKIVQIDSPDRLYAQPRTRFAASFLGSVNLLEVEYAGRGGDDSKWHLLRDNTGTELRLPVEKMDLKDGATIQLGVRCELMRMAAPDAPADPLNNTWRGTLEDAVFLGDSIEYLMRVAGSDMVLKLRVPPYVRSAVGDSVLASIAADDCFAIQS